MPDPTRVKTQRYCQCGAALDARSSASAVAFVVEQFDRVHSGDGHGPATREQAATARRHQDRAMACLLAKRLEGD